MTVHQVSRTWCSIRSSNMTAVKCDCTPSDRQWSRNRVHPQSHIHCPMMHCYRMQAPEQDTKFNTIDLLEHFKSSIFFTVKTATNTVEYNSFMFWIQFIASLLWLKWTDAHSILDYIFILDNYPNGVTSGNRHTRSPFYHVPQSFIQQQQQRWQRQRHRTSVLGLSVKVFNKQFVVSIFTIDLDQIYADLRANLDRVTCKLLLNNNNSTSKTLHTFFLLLYTEIKINNLKRNTNKNIWKKKLWCVCVSIIRPIAVDRSYWLSRCWPSSK